MIRNLATLQCPFVDLPSGARVLLVRLSALGDVLFSLETLAALRRARPDLHVDFLVGDGCASILANHPWIERVLVHPRRRQRALPGALRELRRRRYDVALDLHGILKSALQMRAARARLRVGFAPPRAREGAHLLYDRAVPLPSPIPHRAEQGLVLLRALGLRVEPAPVVLPAPPPHGPPVWSDEERGHVVVLHPGTSRFAAFKRWPPDRYAELAARLSRRGIPVAVSYGPGERPLADVVLEAAPAARPIDGAALGLPALARCLGEAALVVAADTGPLHLAAAAGARVLALFGPKDPAIYGPRGPGHRVLLHDVPCRPCTRRDCVTPQCVLGITVADVERSALELLEAPAREPAGPVSPRTSAETRP